MIDPAHCARPACDCVAVGCDMEYSEEDGTLERSGFGGLEKLKYGGEREDRDVAFELGDGSRSRAA